MSSNKEEATKITLRKANRESKRAPIWAFPKSGRKVRRSPKTGRSWRHNKIYDD